LQGSFWRNEYLWQEYTLWGKPRQNRLLEIQVSLYAIISPGCGDWEGSIVINRLKYDTETHPLIDVTGQAELISILGAYNLTDKVV